MSDNIDQYKGLVPFLPGELWTGNANGRPLAFPTPLDLAERALAYFKACDNHTKVIFGKDGVIDVPDPQPKTIPGLCSHLNICVNTWNNYAKRENYAPVCAWAATQCEASVVDGMIHNRYAQAGSIFYLKNKHGYVDKHEIEKSGEDTTQIRFVWGKGK